MLNAENAASWIANNALLENGAILTRKYLDGENKNFSFDGGNIFAFDTGMVLIGFCNLYKITKKKKYLDISKKIIDFITNILMDENGIMPIINTKDKKYVIDNSKWSFQKGSFLNKVTIGLYEFSNITNDSKFEKLAIKICDKSLSFFKEDNYFITNKDKNYVEIHPLCYSLEGLFFIGKNCNINKFIDLTYAVLAWLEDLFEKNQNIFETYDIKEKKFLIDDRSDIYGQLLRLLKITGKNNKIEKNLEDLIFSMISDSKKKEEKGGVFYNSSNLHINSWSTMFNLQALLIDHKNIRNISDQKIELLV